MTTPAQPVLVLLLPVALLCAACGGLVGGDETEAPPNDNPGPGDHSDGTPATWKPQGPTPVSFQEADYQSGRVIARGGAFDVLAQHDQGGLYARRAAVTGGKLAFTGPAQQLVSGVRNAFEAGVDEDLLALCHNPFSADPLSLSLHTGSYQTADNRVLFPSAAFCNGVAYRAGRGLLAVHMRAGGPCCSSAYLVELGSNEPPRRGLPENEFSSIGLTAYAGGFAWAGAVADDSRVQVTFRPDLGAEQVREIPGPVREGIRAPRLAPWPWDPQRVAVAWNPDQTSVHVSAVAANGTTLDYQASYPTARWVTRPSLASTPSGLAVAFGVCPENLAEPGTTQLLLLDAKGAPRKRAEVGGCGVGGLAATDEHLVLQWGNLEGTPRYRIGVFPL